jgi:dTDP-4-amino-4,6-dideoxygalactose transaminase
LVDTDRRNGTIGHRDGSKLQLASRLPIHVNGRLAPTDSAVIEDSCQAITYHTPGMVSAYSFHSTKIVTALGGGGAVCCDRKEDYETMYAIKDHGRPERVQGKPVTDNHSKWGTNLKFLDAQAAFLMVQLKKLPERLEKLHNDYRLYRDVLGQKVMWLEGEPSWRVDCLVPNPQNMVESLAKSGIQAQRFYLPTHRQKEFRYSETSFPNTTWLYEHGLYLPSSQKLLASDVEFICKKIIETIDA